AFVHLEFTGSQAWLLAGVVLSRLAALGAGWLAGDMAVTVGPLAHWPLPAWGGPWPWSGHGIAAWAALSELSTLFVLAHLSHTLLRERRSPEGAPHATRLIGGFLLFDLLSEIWRLCVLSGTLPPPDIVV